MIKGIYNGGRYMQVNNGSPSWPNIYNTYNSGTSGPQSFTGQMRYNSQTGNMEVFDGNNWQGMANSIAQVGLTAEAESLLDWAKLKRDEELEIEKLAESNPAIKDLVDQIKTKQDQIKMVKTLIKKETAIEEPKSFNFQQSIIP